LSRLARTVPVVLLSGCAQFADPDPTNLATYCTEPSGYRVGYLSKAYFGVCPKETEGAFLAGLAQGRGYRANPPQAQPYYDRMEKLEKQLLAATNDAERAGLRTQLREVETMAVHIINDSGTYSGPM